MGTLTRRSYSISSLGDDYGSIGGGSTTTEGAARRSSISNSNNDNNDKPRGVTWKMLKLATQSPPRSMERHRERHIVTAPTAQAGIENVDNNTNDINPYSMLQIRKDATHAEIKQAYRRHALWHHPGRTAALDNTEEQQRRQRVFMILAACCETLLERESRSRLNLILKEPRNTKAAASKNDQRRHPRRPAFRSTASVSDIPILDLSQDYSSDSEDDDDFDGSVVGWCGIWPWMSCSRDDNKNHRMTSPSNRNDMNRLRKCRQFVRAMSSGSTEEHDHIHYTKAETERLFGGPLSLMYRARMFRPFSDPFAVFERIFGSAVFPQPTAEQGSISHCATPVRNQSTTSRKTTSSPTRAPTSPRNGAKSLQTTKPRSSWTGSFEVLSDGTTVYTTCRILHGRKLIKQERITVDPVTGKKKSTITVTGEDIPEEETNMEGTTSGDRSKSKQVPKQNDSDASVFDCLDCCGPVDFFSACDFSVREDYFGKRTSSDSSVVDKKSGTPRNYDETNNSNRRAIAVS